MKQQKPTRRSSAKKRKDVLVYDVAKIVLIILIGVSHRFMICTALRSNYYNNERRDDATHTAFDIRTNIRHRHLGKEVNALNFPNDDVNVTWMVLAPGESKLLQSVDPAERYFPTGVLLTDKATYSFISKGSWLDAWVKCGPNGFYWPFIQHFNRVSGYNMFYLCGCINKDDSTAFPIGSDLPDWSPTCQQDDTEQSGSCNSQRLYLFANDWWDFYHNNHIDSIDPLSVTITRTK